MTALDLEAVKGRHARLTDGDEYVHWHEWQRRVVDCAGDIPLLVAEVERLRADDEIRREVSEVLDAAHAAGLIVWRDELEQVGFVWHSTQGMQWGGPEGTGHQTERPVFIVRDRNTEAGT